MTDIDTSFFSLILPRLSFPLIDLTVSKKETELHKMRADLKQKMQDCEKLEQAYSKAVLMDDKDLINKSFSQYCALKASHAKLSACVTEAEFADATSFVSANGDCNSVPLSILRKHYDELIMIEKMMTVFVDNCLVGDLSLFALNYKLNILLNNYNKQNSMYFQKLTSASYSLKLTHGATMMAVALVLPNGVKQMDAGIKLLFETGVANGKKVDNSALVIYNKMLRSMMNESDYKVDGLTIELMLTPEDLRKSTNSHFTLIFKFGKTINQAMDDLLAQQSNDSRSVSRANP